MKSIRWWPHARERLVERGIDIKLVRSALEKPDQIITMGKQKIIHKLYQETSRHKEYLLRVFIEDFEEEQVIRTVYRTSKVSKYWRNQS